MPGGAGDGWGGLLAVDAEGGAVEGEDADVVGGGCDYDVGVAEGDSYFLLARFAICYWCLDLQVTSSPAGSWVRQSNLVVHVSCGL